MYWRRRAIAFAGFAVVLLLMVKACGGDGPDLSGKTSQQEPVPTVTASLYSPTPSPSPSPTVDPSAAPTDSRTSDSPIDDPTNTPYTPGGTEVPCDQLPVPDNMVDESGEPLCDDTAAATFGPTADPTKAGKPGKSPSASPSPTSDAQAAGPLSCAKSVLSAKLKTDRDSYSGSQKPKFYLGVKNSGTVECLVDLGSKALSFTVISGNDRIWSSDDCQGKGTSDVRLLKPGQTLWARAVWSKVRSAPGCPKGMDSAKPGYYRLDGTAGGVKADRRAVFQVK